MKRFPFDKFDKSCLIYSKGNYAIFLLKGKNDKYYVVKTKSIGTSIESRLGEEEEISLYIKENYKNMPNLLVPEDIYIDESPKKYSLFTNKNRRLNLPQCKDISLYKIYIDDDYQSYIVTKAGLYNLSYYLGTYGGSLSYKAFVAFSFQILAALQVLHSINIWHRDIKTNNILLFNSENSNISYKYGNKIWTINYSDTDNRDIKIIDYGESKLINDVKNPCEMFKYEVNFALVNVLQTMWNKVKDKQNITDYENLILLLKSCKTKIMDIIINAKIFEQLNYTVDGSPEYTLF